MRSCVLLDLPVKRGCAILGSVNAKEPARACRITHYIRSYTLSIRSCIRCSKGLTGQDSRVSPTRTRSLSVPACHHTPRSLQPPEAATKQKDHLQVLGDASQFLPAWVALVKQLVWGCLRRAPAALLSKQHGL